MASGSVGEYTFSVGFDVGDWVTGSLVGAGEGEGVGKGVVVSFCAVAAVCDELLDTEDGLGFPPVGFLPPVGLVNDPFEGTVGFLVGLPVTAAPMGDLVTENTPSKIGLASSTGEFVGSLVVAFVGGGDGGSLFALHIGVHIAFSLQ